MCGTNLYPLKMIYYKTMAFEYRICKKSAYNNRIKKLCSLIISTIESSA